MDRPLNRPPPTARTARWRGRALVFAIGGGTTVFGFWVGPELLCPFPGLSENGQYCDLEWLLLAGPLVVAAGGLVAGLLDSGVDGLAVGVGATALVGVLLSAMWTGEVLWLFVLVAATLPFIIGFAVGAGVAAVARRSRAAD